jgi:hypothetical protein
MNDSETDLGAWIFVSSAPFAVLVNAGRAQVKNDGS